MLEVSHRPYDPHVPKICLDEGSTQLLAQTRQMIPMEAGEPVRVDDEYERKGVCRLFLAREPETGACQVQVSKRRTKKAWARCVRELVDSHDPSAAKIGLVMDHLNTSTPSSFSEAFDPAEARRLTEKLEIHSTPRHGSWLPMAEIERSVLARQCLSDRFPSQEALTAQVDVWLQERYQAQVAINWRCTTDDARIKLKRLYPSIER
jgi:hypothetical protein